MKKNIIELSKEEKQLLFVIIRAIKNKNDKIEKELNNGKKISENLKKSYNYTKDLAKGLYIKLYEEEN